jgi:FkbM family methyltransferase
MYDIRKFLEHISRRKILKRRLPKRFGAYPIFVTPDASLRYWATNIEKVDAKLLSLCEELVKPGSIVWDVGANVGLFTFSAAALAGPDGRVLAIEPDSFLADLVRRSSTPSNGKRAKVDILPAAISDHVGISEFYIANIGRSQNFLGGRSCFPDTTSTRETQMVVTVTLDWLCDRYLAPTVLKIDVEGSEDRVLKGASRLLREHRPSILCEVAAENAGAVSASLRENGYAFYDAEVEPRERQQLERLTWNTLALPLG